MPKTSSFVSRRLLRIKAAAEYIGLSPFVVRQLVQRGELKAVVMQGHSPWLIDLRDLDDWIERNKVSYAAG
jgi:excisionase family DNA binding protein